MEEEDFVIRSPSHTDRNATERLKALVGVNLYRTDLDDTAAIKTGGLATDVQIQKKDTLSEELGTSGKPLKEQPKR